MQPLTQPCPLWSLLDQYTPFNNLESAHVTQLRQFLASSNNPYSRTNLVAHTVADAWVVSPDRRQVLLLINGASGVWNTPGGHADGSPDMLGTAVRELEEETGLTPQDTKLLLNGGLFDLNVGHLPSRQKSHGFEPVHLHFDICFAFEADPAKVKLTISSESRDLAWKSIDEAHNLMMDYHKRRAEKMKAGWLA